MPLFLHLTRQALHLCILPRRLYIHPHLRGGDLLRRFRLQQFIKPPYLLVCDHPRKRSPTRFRIVLARFQIGNNNRRQQDFTIVADHFAVR